MAKRRRRRLRGTGSVIAVRQLSGSGLGKVGRPGSLLGQIVPPLVGGAVAGGSMLLLEHMGKPADGAIPNETVVMLAENSAWVGIGAGALAAGAMLMLFGTPAGLAAFAGAATVGGTLLGYQALVKTESTATTDPATGPTASPTAGLGRYRYRMRGMGAIVPQMQPPGMNGVGAIVLEPAAMRGLRGGNTRGLGDPRGETVSLGSINPSAFGTPGFSV
jgi:hypothetical protein